MQCAIALLSVAYSTVGYTCNNYCHCGLLFELRSDDIYIRTAMLAAMRALLRPVVTQTTTTLCNDRRMRGA